MSSAREEVLARIRRALGDDRADVAVPREYRGAGSSTASRDEVLDRFAERVADYRAEVHRTAGAAHVIGALLGDRPVVVPDGFPDDLLPAQPLREPLSTDDLDGASAVLTTCAVGIAETGTVVLDHTAGQGRRALTLVPDHHVVVVRAEQVVAGVPDAIAALDPSRPLTFISGPSATSDIELNRVEGVHGPRRLDVVLIAAT